MRLTKAGELMRVGKVALHIEALTSPGLAWRHQAELHRVPGDAGADLPPLLRAQEKWTDHSHDVSHQEANQERSRNLLLSPNSPTPYMVTESPYHTLYPHPPTAPEKGTFILRNDARLWGYNGEQISKVSTPRELVTESRRQANPPCAGKGRKKQGL